MADRSRPHEPRSPTCLGLRLSAKSSSMASKSERLSLERQRFRGWLGLNLSPDLRRAVVRVHRVGTSFPSRSPRTRVLLGDAAAPQPHDVMHIRRAEGAALLGLGGSLLTQSEPRSHGHDDKGSSRRHGWARSLVDQPARARLAVPLRSEDARRLQRRRSLVLAAQGAHDGQG